jgi:beta-glucanase (GH16 family)
MNSFNKYLLIGKTMKVLLFSQISFLFFIGILSLNSCTEQVTKIDHGEIISDKLIIEAESYITSNGFLDLVVTPSKDSVISTNSSGWLAYDLEIEHAGRYQISVTVFNRTKTYKNIWIEDHFGNNDDRTYNITGEISIPPSMGSFENYSKDGSPLNEGKHKLKIHFDEGLKIDKIEFKLIKHHDITPVTLEQNTVGKEWVIAWSDEFDGSVIDTIKWTYDIGDWGWGNNEHQYYTQNRSENSRIEDGNLIIEARKNDMGNRWTSARLTTRGKVSFIHGKIEFRAIVPHEKGNWAAGWTLGDNYVDELSWPYCGEIDILESVGFEMNDTTGTGIAHASAHCGTYYFKIDNQPTAIIEVSKMNSDYHIYTVEWTSDYVKTFVDGIHYFTYEDNSTELSWPFDDPQNLILNLAMGGGWGGAQGTDESVTSVKMIVDYVRVYERN